MKNYNKDNNGYFGEFGGSFVSEKIQAELDKINVAYQKLKKDKKFNEELDYLRRNYQGRPTPLYLCKNLTNLIGGAQIYLKREDLNHTGAHKINHCIGEALLAKYLGKTLVIGETGAGQHGLALATACALTGLDCEIHMGELDIIKQASNVAKMKLLGAKIVSVSTGGKSLKEAVDSAFNSYENTLDHSIYCIGSALGPHPFPTLVRDFQSVVGKEAKKQFSALYKRNPDAIVACVGGGSNAIGIFSAFLKTDTPLFGVEPLGRGSGLGENAATIAFGKTQVFQGFKSLVLLDKDNQPVVTHSIASGLDYPGVGPQHAYLNSIKRVNYVTVNDDEALNAFLTLTKVEGIIPALESSHAVAYAMKLAKTMSSDKCIIANLSGRGDKDVPYVLEKLGMN